MPTPLEFATADAVWDALAEHVKPLKATRYPIERALGGVLAEAVAASGPFPPFDRAVMDGYAVRCADFADGPAELRVAGLARAGGEQAGPIAAGACAQINTGAPLPEGADAVVIVEKSRPLPDGRVALDDRPTPGQHIQKAGELLTAGDELLPAGVRLTPGATAALAAAGVDEVAVAHTPRVALATCGDELVPFEETPGPGQIRDSNRVILEALIEDARAEAVLLGIAPDEPQQLRSMLELGLHNDVLCVVGGMSKGSHDLVPGMLERLGVKWLVTSLNLKPGKPTRIGRAPGGAWVFGLPGNPVSAAVCFLLFARPLLAGLQGAGFAPPLRVRGRLVGELPKSGSRPMYHPGHWSVDADGLPTVAPITWRGSGDPFGLARADALIERLPGDDERPETVSFVPFGWPR